MKTAIGFRVKSGWATAVLLAGPPDGPCVLDRRVVELSEERLPATRQPYHAGTGREETDVTKIAARVKIIKRAARRSFANLIKAYRGRARVLRGAALVVGSLIEPDSIANPHIRAHALEGQLFRVVVAGALRDRGLHSRVVVARDAYAEAARVLGRAESELKRALAAIGRDIGRPWSADQKLAALAAWMCLAEDI